MNKSIKVLFGALALVAAASAIAPQTARAQDAKVYTASEVTSPARLRSPNAAAAAVERTYPHALRSVGGRVQLQFVVQENGRVDPESIEVIVASANQLADAAKRAIQQIEFQPGQVNGTAVRSIVQFPITYAVN